MAVFTAIGAAVAGAIGLAAGTLAFTVVSTIVAVGASMVVSRLINGSPDSGGGGGGAQQDNPGTRIQLPPGTANKVPVLYGKAFINPIIVDAYISDDNKQMTYAMVLTEVVNVQGINYQLDNIYWNDLRLEFEGTTVKRGRKRADAAYNEPEDYVDENYKDLITFHCYRWDPVSKTVVPLMGRSGSGVYNNTTAYADCPIKDYWTTADHQLEGFVFAIMTMKYSSDKGLTGLATMTFEMSNTASNPAVALLDYMTSERYGGAVNPLDINYESFVEWGQYCNENVPWQPIDGGETQQSPRYRINGVVNTNNNVKQNIDSILLNCGAWMAFDVQQGQWRVIVKKAEQPKWYFGGDEIISGITLSSSSLTDLYNEGEAQFYDSKNKDQQAYSKIYLRDTAPHLLNYNEPANQMTMNLEFCNNNIQAERILNQELEQARDDLVISFTTTHYGLQVQAGDVIGVRSGVPCIYGWDDLETYNQGFKPFRVVRVKEIETDEGGLGAEITALEYNEQVYDDRTISEFYPRENIGIINTNGSNSLPPPDISIIETDPNGSIPRAVIRITTPDAGGPFTAIEIFAAEGDDYSGLGADAYFRGQILGTQLTASGFPTTNIGQQLWLDAGNNAGYSSELFAVGMEPGTKITGYIDGNGGNGNYTINNDQTLSVRSIYATVNRAKFIGSIQGDTLTVTSIQLGSGNLAGISLITEECVIEGYLTAGNGTNGADVGQSLLEVKEIITGTVRVGQTIIGRVSQNSTTVVTKNTKILSQLSGTTGGVGTYVVNKSMSIGTNYSRILMTADILTPGTTITAQLTGAQGQTGTYRLSKSVSGSLTNIPFTMKFPYPMDTNYVKIEEIRPVNGDTIPRNEQREISITGLPANSTDKKYFLRGRTVTTNNAGANVYGPFSDLGELDLEVPAFFWDPDNNKLKEQILKVKETILKLDFGKLVLPNNGYWVMKTMTEIDFGELKIIPEYQLDLGLTAVVENEVTIDDDFESFLWQEDPPPENILG